MLASSTRYAKCIYTTIVSNNVGDPARVEIRRFLSLDQASGTQSPYTTCVCCVSMCMQHLSCTLLLKHRRIKPRAMS